MDDSIDDQNLYGRLLSNIPNQSFEITTCLAGGEGVALARTGAFDCILLDFHLPDMNGLEILSAIANEEGRLPCAVIVVTGQGSETIAVDAMKKGAEDYLVKGTMGGDHLHSAICNAIERVTLRDQLAAARRQLAEQVRIAQEANRAKSAFLADISHELRTPMGAMLGFAELLLVADDTGLSPSQRYRIEMIVRGGRQMMTIIEDLLDVAQIEVGALRVKKELVEVNSLFEEVEPIVAALASERGLTLEVIHPADPAIIWADRARVCQILVNFGSNAVKYNKPRGEVRLRAHTVEGRWLRLTVADTGLGIPDHRQGEVFEMFNRLGADGGTVQGTGIGLAISRRLCELMEGRIGFSSTLGVGSTFWVDLPVARSLGQQKARTSTSLGSPIETTSFKLLHIEDNATSADLVRDIIALFPNASFATAVTGEAGLALAHEFRPDIILLDIRLPDINGHEVYRRLQLARETAHVPVIALTAEAMTSSLDPGRQIGFAKYITKPYAISALTNAILQTLKLTVSVADYTPHAIRSEVQRTAAPAAR